MRIPRYGFTKLTVCDGGCELYLSACRADLSWRDSKERKENRIDFKEGRVMRVKWPDGTTSYSAAKLNRFSWRIEGIDVGGLFPIIGYTYRGIEHFAWVHELEVEL